MVVAPSLPLSEDGQLIFVRGNLGDSVMCVLPFLLCLNTYAQALVSLTQLNALKRPVFSLVKAYLILDFMFMFCSTEIKINQFPGFNVFDLMKTGFKKSNCSIWEIVLRRK